MKTVYKKAISLANKNGQNFIKEMAAYYTYIGIEEGNISNWFVLIAKSKETGKYICLSISRYDSGGAASTFYGDLKHFCLHYHGAGPGQGSAFGSRMHGGGERIPDLGPMLCGRGCVRHKPYLIPGYHH